MAKAEGKIFNFEDTSKIDPKYLETFGLQKKKNMENS